VLLRLEGKRVNVDAHIAGNVLVVLEGLNQVEVRTGALGEAVVTIELEFRLLSDVARATRGAVVGPFVGVVTAQHIVALDNPNKLFHRVVEVELDAVVGSGDGLITSELELFDQVFVGQLSEAATLVSVQEDVIDPEGGSEVVVGTVAILEAVFLGLEVDVHLDLVVLQGNEGESKSHIPAEPELERDVQSLGGGAIDFRADHLLVTSLLAGGQRELVPDVHPI
jgi:hypothetical protein